MSLRVITARLNGSPADHAVLNGALSIAKAFDGHIDALFARPDPRLVLASIDEGVYPGFYEEMVTHMERDWTDVANKALKSYERWRNDNHVRELQAPDGAAAATAEWRDAVGSEAETTGRAGRVSDLVVTGLPTPNLEKRYDFSFEAALLEAGRPVLFVPMGHPIAMPVARVIVAWNGSAEAFRAVTAAMPILMRAEDVFIYTAAEGEVTETMAENLLLYLKWQGVPASVLQPGQDGGKSVEEGLLAAVRRAKADVLVMGAYTHSRIRELVFGGVTRHVLAHAKLPVLMAH